MTRNQLLRLSLDFKPSGRGKVGKYGDVLFILIEVKKLSMQECAEWLKDNGVKASRQGVYNAYKNWRKKNPGTTEEILSRIKTLELNDIQTHPKNIKLPAKTPPPSPTSEDEELERILKEGGFEPPN